MKWYKINYFCCVLSMMTAIINACFHQLSWMFINFGLAVYNYYVGKWYEKRYKELEDLLNGKDNEEDN